MKRRYISLFLLIGLLLAVAPLVAVCGSRADLQLNTKGGIVRLAAGNFAMEQIRCKEEALDALDQLKEVYGYKNASDALVFDKTVAVAYGNIYKFSQMYRGYPVFGRGLHVAVAHNGTILSVSGNYLDGIAVAEAAALTESDAADIIASLYADCPVYSMDLAVYSLYGKTPLLVYHAVTGFQNGTRLFVSAETGEIVDEIPLSEGMAASEPVRTTQTDYYGNEVDVTIDLSVDTQGARLYALTDGLRNIHIMDNANSARYDGKLYTSATGHFEDGIAVSALTNYIKSFDYYADARNIGVALKGIDNSVNDVYGDAVENDEISIYAYMHFGDAYQNAGYSPGVKGSRDAVFMFGDGVPEGLYNPAVALDIVGHEYQHAVTEYAGGLIYYGASGAINEAYSDIFGALIEGYALTDDRFWLIGEDVDFSGYGATRSMKNPGSFGYPAHYDNRSSFYNNYDNGGVHINSSILTHVQYKLYQRLPAHFTAANIGKLWYAALGTLPQDAGFDDFRVLLRQTAYNLGWSKEVLEVMDACFESSGVPGEAGIHTVTFSAGSFAGTLPDPVTAVYGDEFTIPFCDLRADGIELSAWSESGTTEDKIYYPGASYKMPAYSFTLRPLGLISMWNGLEPSVWAGSGLYSDPYLIQNEADLATLAYYINNRKVLKSKQPIEWKNFKLTKDLDLENIPWIPIGLHGITDSINGPAIFFDGDGHSIHNLTISDSLPAKFEAQGLFGYIQCDVKNLGIESGRICSGAKYLGAIAGRLYGSIKNCYNKIAVTSTNTASNFWDRSATGGLAGIIYFEIDSSFNAGDISGNYFVGGLAGKISTDIFNCYNTGNISGVDAGGLLGGKLYPWLLTYAEIDGQTIYDLGLSRIGNVYNSGGVQGDNAGGIAGNTTDVYYANCLNTGSVSGISDSSNIGGIVGWLNAKAEHGYSNKLDPVHESSMITGCKNTGSIAISGAGYSGGIVGKMFDSEVVGNVFYENNVFMQQGSMKDIGNYTQFGVRERFMFQGEPATSSADRLYQGAFAFDYAEFYRDRSNWAVTGWSGLFGIGYDWEISGPNTLPVLKQRTYWINFRASAFAGGSGTKQDPYRIATAEQLALLAYSMNYNDDQENPMSGCYFQVTADIDLTGNVWVSIDRAVGRASETIYFDGGGYSIKHMFARDYTQHIDDYYGSKSHDAYAGLFGTTSASIRHLVLEDCDVLGSYAAGAIAARMEVNANPAQILLADCEVRSGIVIGGEAAGGMTGVFEAWCGTQDFNDLYNCAVVAGNRTAGGLFGSITLGGSIREEEQAAVRLDTCVNRGEVRAFGENEFFVSYKNRHIRMGASAGGLIGRLALPQTGLKNCINAADITQYDYFGSSGAFVGSLDLNRYGKSYKMVLLYSVAQGRIKYLTSPFSAQGALIGTRFLVESEWQDDTFDILIQNVYYHSNIASALPDAFRRASNVFYADSNLHASDDPEHYDFENFVYFTGSSHFDTSNYGANQLYYYMNGMRKICNVTFLDYNSEMYSRQLVPYGWPAKTPEPPARPPTEHFSYLFAGWDNGFYDVTSDLIIRPEFEAVPRIYTVTLKIGAETYDAMEAVYGSKISLPDDPVKRGYTFDGWYVDETLQERFLTGSLVAGNTVLYAKFNKTPAADPVCGCGTMDFGWTFITGLLLPLFAAVTVFRKRTGRGLISGRKTH